MATWYYFLILLKKLFKSHQQRLEEIEHQRLRDEKRRRWNLMFSAIASRKNAPLQPGEYIILENGDRITQKDIDEFNVDMDLYSLENLKQATEEYKAELGFCLLSINERALSKPCGFIT